MEDRFNDIVQFLQTSLNGGHVIFWDAQRNQIAATQPLAADDPALATLAAQATRDAGLQAAQPPPAWAERFAGISVLGMQAFFGAGQDDLWGLLVVLTPDALDPAQTAAVNLSAQALGTALHLRHEKQQANTLRNNLAEKSEILDIHLEISQLATSEGEWEAVLPHMAERCSILFNADACAITIWDAQEGRSQRLAAWGIDAEAFLADSIRPKDAPSLTREVVKDMQPVFLNNIDLSQPQPSTIITEYEPKSMVTLPLMARGRAIGAVFMMRLVSETPFVPEKVLALTPSLDQMALAIDNQLLLSDTQAQLIESNALLEVSALMVSANKLETILEETLEFIRQMLVVPASAIYLYDEPSESLNLMADVGSFGVPDAADKLQFSLKDRTRLIVDVFVSGQPKFINEVNTSTVSAADDAIAQQLGIQKALVVPLRTHEYAMGVLAVYNKATDFSYRDMGVLTAISSHIAAALRNAELLRNTQLRLNETEILQRVATLTAAMVDENELLNIAVSEVAGMLGASGAFLALVAPQQHRLNIHQASRYGGVKDWGLDVIDLTKVDDPIVQAFQRQEPIRVQAGAVEGKHLYQNLLAVPLRTHQTTLGILCLFDRHAGDFTPAQRNLALSVASQLAVGLQSVQLFAKERQRADLMLLINQIAQELTATLDIRSLMRKVVTNIHDTLGYDAVYMFLYEESQGELVCQASATTHERHRQVEGFAMPPNRGLVGRAYQTKTAQLVYDLIADEDYIMEPGHEELRSALVVPLVHSDTTFGVIELLGLSDEAFNEADLNAMESLATQIGVAFDNASLYDQVQRRLLEQGIVHQIGQDLTSILDYQELMTAVARHMTRALATSACTVAIYDESRDRIFVEADYRVQEAGRTTSTLTSGASYHLSKFHAARQAIEDRKIVITYVDDEKAPPQQIDQLKLNGGLSELIMPIAIGKRVIGMVRWAESNHIRRYSRDDQRLAQTIISQAAIAIENARLFREIERRAKEQGVLYQVTLALSSVNTVDGLVEQLTQQVHDAIVADNTLIALLDDDLNMISHSANLTTLEQSQMVLGELAADITKGKMIRKSLRQGLSVFTAPGYSTQTAGQIELAMLLVPVRSVAIVPILHRGGLLGAIEASSDLNNAIDQHTVTMLESIANQAAIAIDNVRLSEREQRRMEQMERMQNSGRIISSELVMQNLLDLVVQEASKIFDVSAIAVSMPDELGMTEVIRASYGLSDKYIAARRSPIELGQDEFMQLSAQERRQPIYIPDLSTQGTEMQRKLVVQEGLQSALVIPLVKGSHRFGNLILYNRDRILRFRDADLEIAQLLAGQIAIAVDNANLFKASEQRAQELAEANRLRSQFLANISHELRTPMNSILGFSETILSGLYGDLNEKQESRLERILRNGQSLLALIDDLLDLSKIDAGRMEIALQPVDLADQTRLILQTLESQANAKGIYLRSDIPDDVPRVMADPMRFQQVLTNLVGNAMKFTREGGVSVQVQTKEEIVLTPAEGENPTRKVVWVSVVDTGIGISLEDQLVIFDEFRQVDGSATRQFGGTGLGLAICKRLIEMMDGRIWVDSEENEGSTFTFVLPVAE